MSWRRNGRDGSTSVTTMQVWIGTSGYSYSDWVGEFYPEGTSSSRMLSHYCRHFPAVELNFTFYKPPTRMALTRLADKTPPNFQFLVKVPQSISHASLAQTSALAGCERPANGIGPPMVPSVTHAGTGG